MSEGQSKEATDMIATALLAWGCPPGQCGEMAAQLDRRAHQLASTQNKSYEDALTHLLGMMRQGWSARIAEGGQTETL